MDTELKGWLQSSQDPSEVANKVKGVILMGSSIVIAIAARLMHVTLSPADMLSFATDMGTIAGAIWAVYGAGLHLITWWGTVVKQ